MTDVIYIEAMSNYVIIHTRLKKYVTYLTFSGIEEQLPSNLFVRIHKSYMVAIAAIQTIDGNEVITSSMRLPMSKNYRNEVMSKIESRFIKRT
jgi:DNA-binding LytR/AlgR family response regulator